MMRKFIVTFIIAVMALSSFAQDLSGKWQATLSIQSVKLRIVFNIKNEDGKYSSTMDSPDQGAMGLKVESTSVFGSVITLKMPNMGAEYFGVYNSETDIIDGTFKQMGQSFTLNLSRDLKISENIKRPQEPKKPFSYISEDVVFVNPIDGVSLSGTLALPNNKGSFPTVILISGSGPQNRNEELLGHKPFLLISDFLCKKGFAVLRFDDRGVGKSTGEFSTATTEDFAGDVEAALLFLQARKDIDSNKIGLIGHSEGGIIAPMIASKSDDVDFIVLLAGTALPGGDIINMQTSLIAQANGQMDKDIQPILDFNSSVFNLIKLDDIHFTDSLDVIVRNHIELLNKNSKMNEDQMEQMFDKYVSSFSSPWFKFFVTYDPAIALEKVSCPVLALNGSKDMQVPANENLAAMNKALLKANNKNFETHKLKGLNHLFQECKTGNPREYADIEQTMSPLVLDMIYKWIVIQTNDNTEQK